eukprot:CCRYP_000168-RA/>CCRYP_000168-RA protein AED:0.42 eAED:0.47 QI:0/0/0/1/0/0/4/0/246
MSWGVVRQTSNGLPNPDGAHQQAKISIKKPLICSSTFLPGCTNPPCLNNTALVDTAENITLLEDGAPSTRVNIQSQPKSVLQPKEEKLLTTEDLHLLLHKLPPTAREAHRAPGISHSLVSAATLADAGYLAQQRNHLARVVRPSNSTRFHSTEKSSCKGGETQQLDSGVSLSSQTAATTLFPPTKSSPTCNHKPTSYTNAITPSSLSNFTMLPWATRQLTRATCEGGEDSLQPEYVDSSNHPQSVN